MTLTQPYQETEIKIETLEFSKHGKIWFSGTVNGEIVCKEVDASSCDFDSFLPRMDTPYEVIDCEGLFNAELDDFHNLHFLVKTESGNILERVVRLESIVENMLYNAYVQNH